MRSNQSKRCFSAWCTLPSQSLQTALARAFATTPAAPAGNDDSPIPCRYISCLSLLNFTTPWVLAIFGAILGLRQAKDQLRVRFASLSLCRLHRRHVLVNIWRAPSARPWRHGSHALLLLDADSEWSTSRRFAPQSAHNQSFETWPQSAQNNNIARDTYLCTVGPQKIQVFSAKVQIIMHLSLITQRS